MIPAKHQMVVIGFDDYQEIYHNKDYEPLAMRVNLVDGEIVGFVCLNESDCSNILKTITEFGIEPIAVVDNGGKIRQPCGWLECGVVDGVIMCWTLQKEGSLPNEPVIRDSLS